MKATPVSNFRLLLLFALSLGLLGLLRLDLHANGEVSLTALQPTPLSFSPDRQGGTTFQLLKARNAVALGLHHIALQEIEELIQSTGNPKLIVEAKLLKIEVLLANGELDQASQLLEDLSDNPRFALLESRLLLLRGEESKARRSLARVRLDALNNNPFEKGWYHLLNGMLKERVGRQDGAMDDYNLAFSIVEDTPLSPKFQSYAFLNGFASRETSESERVKISRQLRTTVNSPLRAQLITALGLSQFANGLKDEARATLTGGAVEFELAEFPEKYLLLAALAYVTGLEAPESRPILKRILISARGNAETTFALQALLYHHTKSTEDATELSTFLGSLVDTQVNHPMLPSLRYALGFLTAIGPTPEKAVELLNSALQTYPNHPFALQAYDTLAAVAAENKNNARAAADALIRSIALVDDPQEQSMRWKLVGDIYFQNRDFANAADAYRRIARQSPFAAVSEVLSLIQEGSLNRAIERLDTISPAIAPSPRWEAEWLVSTALIRDNRSDQAIDRIRKIAQESENVERRLRERLSWLQVYAMLESNRPRQAADLARNWRVAGKLETFEPRTADALLLLEGQAFYAALNPTEGAAALKLLRERSPESDAAILSLLIEARFLAGRDEPRRAITDLTKLASLYPNNQYIPVALFEAGLLAISLGTPEGREEGLTLLDRIVSNYREHYIAFHAQYKIGEVLILAGNYTAARLAFENGLREFPSHPERYFFEIALSDSILANPDAGEESILLAESRLRRITENLNHPPSLRIEAAVKRAKALQRLKRTQDAERVFWAIINQHLSDSSVPADPRVRFWLARAILEFSQSLRADQKLGEARSVEDLLRLHRLPQVAL
ncbi:MAG: tetratricopeptide repeat protein [Puniceicoccaceae bacterium]